MNHVALKHDEERRDDEEARQYEEQNFAVHEGR
jgi:hypothetical protein